MNNIRELEDRRNQILEEMRLVRFLNRGTINEQYFKTYPKGKKGAVVQGPYYVLSRREKGKTVSQRLNSSTELEQAKRDVAEHKKFITLCREFEELTIKIGELERNDLGCERKKKRLSSPSNKTRK